MVLLTAVPLLLQHPVVLSCGCSQSSEAVRTRRERERERGRKPHEEKSVSYNSNNEHGFYICPLYYHRILYHSNTTESSGILAPWFGMLCVGWFCSACSLSSLNWKTLQPLFLIRSAIEIFH